ncbi:MAG: hypothetical protein ACYTBS_14010 [Planctomycetota bacterium]
MDFRTGSPDRPDPKRNPARKAMGFARWLSERADLASLTPQKDLASTEYCLVNPGIEYLIYQPQGGGKNFSVNLRPDNYVVEWTDPATGAVTRAEDVQVAGGQKVFASILNGSAILHLKRKL